MSEPKPTLRSTQWFGTADKNGFMYRNWVKNQGIPDHELDDRSIIGIYSTWSELTPCSTHFCRLAEYAKRGIYEAGGFPMEFPMFSSSESNLHPTVMLTRNLAVTDVEEAIRGSPIDVVVLLTGCDRTTPTLLMGTASCDVLAIIVTGRPMLDNKFDGKNIGFGTAVWQLHESLKVSEVDLYHFLSAKAGTSRSVGTCNIMGTASTVVYMAEAFGTSFPHDAAIPVVDARRYVLAYMSGTHIVEVVLQGLTLSKILTRAALESTIRVNTAIGGSTNAAIHLKAIAGRTGAPLELEDRSRIGRDTPTIADLMSSGRFPIEEFYYAGGLPAVLRRLGETNPLSHPDTLAVNDKILWENVKDAPITGDKVICPLDEPLVDDGGIRVLHGNLTSRSAVFRPSAANPELLRYRGRVMVFGNLGHYKEHTVDEMLDVGTSSMLVMKSCEPKGYPGMAEVDNTGLPPKLLRQGVRDMMRISDARMSGAVYGIVVLHVAPGAAAGGSLAVVQDDDWIELDCEAGTLHLDTDDVKLAHRMATYQAPYPHGEGGDYRRPCIDRVLQTDESYDLDFLIGYRDAAVPRHSH